MSSRRSHDELIDLLAPYAINSVTEDERREVESFLESNPQYREEVATYQEAAAMLAMGHEQVPVGVWERIESAIEPAAPPMRLVDQRRSADAIVKRMRAILAAVSGVAVALAIGIGVVLFGGSWHTANVTALADEAAQTPGARTVSLSSADRSHSASIVITPDGQGYFRNGNLPELDPDRTYQLWIFTTSGDPVSVGILGSAIKDSGFMVSGAISTVAITVEPAGGAPAPTSEPLVTGSFAA